MRAVFMVGVALASLAFSSGSQAQTTAPSTQPVGTPSVNTVGLLQDAVTAYRAGRFEDAARIAQDIAKSFKRKTAPITDALLRDSLHVQLIANLKLGRHPVAAELANQLFQNAAADRSMLLNVASCDIRARSYVVRSVNMLRDFAVANPTDEEAVNMWGAALATLAKQAKPSVMEEHEAAYIVVDRQLEATRPGMKRWGSEWMSSEDFKAIEKQKSRARDEIKSAENDVEYAARNLQDAQDDVNRAQAAMRDVRRDQVRRRQARLDEAQRVWARARDHYKQKVKELDLARDAMPKPTWIAPAGPFLPDYLAGTK